MRTGYDKMARYHTLKYAQVHKIMQEYGRVRKNMEKYARIHFTAASLLSMVEMKLRSNFWVDFNVKFDI